MKWTVAISDAAGRDVVRATRWYAKHNPGASVKFAAAVDVVLDALEDQPLRFPIVRKTTRRANLTGFPYGLLFRAFNAHVVVTACAHFRRHQRHWRADE